MLIVRSEFAVKFLIKRNISHFTKEGSMESKYTKTALFLYPDGTHNTTSLPVR